MIVAKTKTKLGPNDHGRKLSLKALEFAEVEEGYHYELARGYVVASEVANYYHQMQIVALNSLLWAYFSSHAGVIHAICGSQESKLLIPGWESERHPDISIYLSEPKKKKNRTMWRAWIPELVIEVVPESSRDRDYTEKRDEYWTLGVKVYWIVDAKLKKVLVLRRGRSQWTEKALGPADSCETKLLPGFRLPCGKVFEAAG